MKSYRSWNWPAILRILLILALLVSAGLMYKMRIAPQLSCPSESERVQDLQKGLDEVYREQVACTNHLQHLLKARSTCEVDRDTCAQDYDELMRTKNKWQDLAHDCVKELTRLTSTSTTVEER